MLLLMSSFSTFSSQKPFPSLVQHGSHYPLAFAYFISGVLKIMDFSSFDFGIVMVR
ncbi:hypothetical protein MTR_7g027990 [Medicago truncatula]|uniref:Uncharacterized protein n=1 Tax=Medicago truncatula TaxID=3880 RepID=G7L270_MEDTR|nr:hypothetical protein MTR_7g027990 [Medicago truncatula]